MAAPRALHYAAAVSLLVTAVTSVSAQAPAKTLPEQIADVMVQLNGGIHPGFRFTHAKGLVASGTFTPAPAAKPGAAEPRASPEMGRIVTFS